MALRFKKDVQKASYYVWFLGAQEAKELRGEGVLTSTIPRLIERSRQQEPLKVTLQVSHKGLKIIQVRSCTTQSSTDVADMLYMYNSNHFQFSHWLFLAWALNIHTRYDFNTEQFFSDVNYQNTKILTHNIVLLFTRNIFLLSKSHLFDGLSKAIVNFRNAYYSR